MNIGLIGAGSIGRIHAEILRKHITGAQITVVAEVYANDETVEWANGLGIGKVVKDYHEVLADPAVDAVFICSSTDTHTQIIMEAARAGKQIFCEKPISYDIEKIVEALRVVKECGVKLQIGFNRRFDHNFGKIRSMVQDGKIGGVQVVKITSRDPAPPPIPYIKVSGGIFLDMMIHDFDMARFLSGSEVETVYAQGAVLVDPAIGEAGDVDTAIVTLRFANGALGVIDNSRQAVYGHDQRVEVFGAKGCLIARNDTDTAVDYYAPEGMTSDNPIRPFRVRYEAAYAAEAQAFVDAVSNGEELAVDGWDGLQPILIGLAATQSLKEGKPVAVRRLDKL